MFIKLKWYIKLVFRPGDEVKRRRQVGYFPKVGDHEV